MGLKIWKNKKINSMCAMQQRAYSGAPFMPGLLSGLNYDYYLDNVMYGPDLTPKMHELAANLTSSFLHSFQFVPVLVMCVLLLVFVFLSSGQHSNICLCLWVINVLSQKQIFFACLVYTKEDCHKVMDWDGLEIDRLHVFNVANIIYWTFNKNS